MLARQGTPDERTSRLDGYCVIGAAAEDDDGIAALLAMSAGDGMPDNFISHQFIEKSGASRLDEYRRPAAAL